MSNTYTIGMALTSRELRSTRKCRSRHPMLRCAKDRSGGNEFRRRAGFSGVLDLDVLAMDLVASNFLNGSHKSCPLWLSVSDTQ